MLHWLVLICISEPCSQCLLLYRAAWNASADYSHLSINAARKFSTRFAMSLR